MSQIINEKFTDRFAGMAWNCHIGYMIFYAYLGKNFYFAQCLGICGISWNQGVCLKGHFGEKTSLNPSQFLVLLKMVWHMHKVDGDKDFQSSLLSNIQFWQFYNPIPSHLEDFTDRGILCCKCSLPPGTTKIWHGVGISNFQSNMVWQNKMCGCSLAYGCNAFQKMGNIKICRIKG